MAPDRNRTPIAPAARATRWLAAVAVVVAGAVHLQQYYGVYYRVVPIIGPLFVADFVLSLVLAAVLIAPIQRWSPVLSTLVAVGGILFEAGAIIGLEISERGTLLGFHEHGYRLAVVLALAFEAAAILLLGLSLVLQRRTPVALEDLGYVGVQLDGARRPWSAGAKP